MSDRMKVLVVEDAADSAELVTALLEGGGYETRIATDGTTALSTARAYQPDLVVLDLGLPDADGLELCTELRSFSDAYIVMLTARDEEVDKVLGLKLGADDYITKPFSGREFMARVGALLRRPRVPSTNERVVGDLTLRPEARQVLVAGNEIDLTKIEYDILDALTERPDAVVSRSVLRERVWGATRYADDHVVDVHIANLRKKIAGPAKTERIKTVRGVGYRMAEVSRSDG
ncbi:MAG: response regulator transcription factor [Actinomycetes bacterium]